MPQRPFQLSQVAGHHRPDVGIDDHGAGALVLPKLRQNLAGQGNKRRVGQPTQRLQRHAFVGRIEEGKQEGDRHPVHLGLGNQRHQGIQRFRGQVFQNVPVVFHPLGQSEAQFPGGQRRGAVHVQIVKLGPALPPDFQNVLKPQGGHQRGAAPLAFQQGIGGHGGPVNKVGLGHAHLGHAAGHALGRVSGSRGQLVDAQLAVGQHCDVGKRAAHVNSHHGSGHNADSSESIVVRETSGKPSEKQTKVTASIVSTSSPVISPCTMFMRCCVSAVSIWSFRNP